MNKSNLSVMIYVFTVISFFTQNSIAALLVGDWGNKAGGVNDIIISYDGTTGISQGPFASGGGLDAPTDMTFGPDGNLYVSSAGSDSVIRYDGQTGAYLGVATAGGLDFPWALAFGPDKNLYVSNPLGIFPNSVVRYNGTTGAFIDVFASGLQNIRQLAFGPDNNLYVVDNVGDSVVRFDGATGTYIDTFVSTDLLGPHGLTFGPDGNLYITDQTNNRVVRFNGTTGAFIDTFATFGLVRPYGLKFAPDGNLYVADSTQNAILQYNGTTGAFMSVFASGSGLTGPHALAFTPPVVPEPTSTALALTATLFYFGRRLSRARKRDWSNISVLEKPCSTFDR